MDYAGLVSVPIRGCPTIFLAQSPVLASGLTRRAIARSPARPHPASAAAAHRHWVAARSAYANRTAATPGSPAPWLRSSPCAPHAASDPRHGVCMSHRTPPGRCPGSIMVRLVHDLLSAARTGVPASNAGWRSLRQAMAPVLGSAQPAYPACPLNRGNLILLRCRKETTP